MDREEFIKYIESIGFEYKSNNYHVYKDCQINVSIFYNSYSVYINLAYMGVFTFYNLKIFKKYERSFKLGKILG